MTPIVITAAEALSRILTCLRVPAADGPAAGLALPFVAQAIRRAAHILAPCPRHELERAVCLSLVALMPEDDRLTQIVPEALDLLIAYGDLIEMRAQSEDPWSRGPLVIRPAPPAFVIRGEGSAIILGVAGDDVTLLSGEAYARLSWHGVLRIIRPEATVNLGSFLSEMGSIQLSEKTWLRLPQVESASSYIRSWEQRLPTHNQPILGLEGLQVIDGNTNPDYYKGRWITSMKNLTGLHIARRMQKYGNPLWCLVDIISDAEIRLLDLTALAIVERPCDVAWRVQMAKDALAGKPQHAAVQETGDHSIVRFFSPLPMWAERKLAASGVRDDADHCLLAYKLPRLSIGDITVFLQDYLWLSVDF